MYKTTRGLEKKLSKKIYWPVVVKRILEFFDPTSLSGGLSFRFFQKKQDNSELGTYKTIVLSFL